MKTIHIPVTLEDELAKEAEELLDEEPGFLPRIVEYALASRAAIRMEMRTHLEHQEVMHAHRLKGASELTPEPLHAHTRPNDPASRPR